MKKSVLEKWHKESENPQKNIFSSQFYLSIYNIYSRLRSFFSSYT